ncbi:hypothetical protein HNR46_001471 [Haloferula luteola]|uniref:Uncharacterized protein n=1 Tax=Haloferula luteola TaxID=595692 RepID=A0A840UYM1_9BACT|nr:hypothetical protein [Haloferula luteola]MBB5351237.1 hypothetical protein [Haloferula luteola]
MPSPDSFTDPSERMKALFDAAIRSPELSATQKTFEPPSTPAPAPVPAQAFVAPAPVEAPQARQTPHPAPSPAVSHVETDTELTAMLEERNSKLEKKKGRARVLANLALLLLVVAPATAVMVHPGLRAKFDWLVQNLGKGMDDVKSMADTKDSYDQALDRISSRGDQIDDATRALGGDPNSVVPGEDPEMKQEMAEFMGEEAEGFDRRRAGLEKMGFVAKKLTGMDEEKPAESTSESH